MEATLLHYYNETTDKEYLVIRPDGDDEDYREEGYELLNECELLNADVTLPLSTIYVKEV